MSRSHYPLKRLFDELRKSGFPLGVAEYDDFLCVLETRFLDDKTNSYDALKRLTRLLWFTSGQSRELFNELFDMSWRQEIEARRTQNQQQTENLPSNPDNSEHEFKPQPQPKIDVSIEPEPVLVKHLEAIQTEHGNPQKTYWLSLKSNKLVMEADDKNKADEEIPSAIRFDGGYFPINQRTLTLLWRLLKTGGRKNHTNELDTTATVDSYVRNAGFLTPVYRHSMQYNPRLVVLIDHSPSMVAFHDFSKWMAGIAPLNTFSDLPSLLYFSNVPEGYLYEDQSHQKGYSIRHIRSSFEKKPLRILIISDAGAARGGRSRARIISTQRALLSVAPFTKSLVWVNPMPKHRWHASSAEDIAKMAPMLEASDAGMTHAINILRGKSLQKGIGV